MESGYNNKNGQYLFKFPTRTYLGEEDFFVTACNETAYKAIKLWPYWQNFALNLYGPKSSGKSHLAHIWINRIQKSLQKPEAIPVLSASTINMKNVNRLNNEHNFLVIENVTTAINEEAFFHLYNFFNIPEKFILFTSEQPLSKLPVKLPDLQSRLRAIPAIEITEPDDEMLTALIAKQFNDQQIIISQEILNYILNNAERSFDFITRLVEEISDISWVHGRAVSIPIVREALKNLMQNQQLELFI